MQTSSLFSTLATLSLENPTKRAPAIRPLKKAVFVRFDEISLDEEGITTFSMGFVASTRVMRDFILANDGDLPVDGQTVNVVVDGNTNEVTTLCPEMASVSYGKVECPKIGLSDIATAIHIWREGGDPFLRFTPPEKSGLSSRAISLKAVEAFRETYGYNLEPGLEITAVLQFGGPQQCALATHIRPA